MLLVKLDWVPKDEFVVAYEGNSNGFVGYKTQGANGDIHYYRKITPPRARKPRWVKVHTIPRLEVEREKQRLKETTIA